MPNIARLSFVICLVEVHHKLDNSSQMSHLDCNIYLVLDVLLMNNELNENWPKNHCMILGKRSKTY